MENHDWFPQKYDPNWAEVFKAQANKISEVLGGSILKLHHIGSTAVVGLSAKPIIDILGEAKAEVNFANYEHAMRALDFEFKGEYGMSLRSFFQKKSPPGVHLHIFPAGHPQITKHLIFRDYLNENPSAKNAYQKKKEEIISRPSITREEYQKAKNQLISELTIASYKWKGLPLPEDI